LPDGPQPVDNPVPDEDARTPWDDWTDYLSRGGAPMPDVGRGGAKEPEPTPIARPMPLGISRL
jgi:hypothetical protein